MKKKILIVDDEQDVRIFLKYNLEKEGYDISTAADGRDALSQMKDVEFDLVISDVMMPEMNGISMMKAMQEFNVPSAPVIFLTASSDELHYISALLAGCHDFLSKPISLVLLKQKISEALYSTRKLNSGFDDSVR